MAKLKCTYNPTKMQEILSRNRNLKKQVSSLEVPSSPAHQLSETDEDTSVYNHVYL